MSPITSRLVILAIGVGCGCGSSGTDGGWVFTATVNEGQGTQAVDLAAGASLTIGSNGFSLSGEDVGASCTHTIRFSVPAPLAVQTYALAWFGGPLAQYTDCQRNGYVYTTDSTHGGDLTVTRADSSCAQPPCIDATFGFSLYEPTSPDTSVPFSINNGHISNY